jgi:hypothetical protein
MKYLLPTLTIAMVAALAQAQTSELPANIKADINRLQADHAVLKSDFQNMRKDHEQFWNDAKPILKADHEAIQKAVDQLKADRSAKKDEKTLQSDEAAVVKAIEHKKADKEALFGALPFHREGSCCEGGCPCFPGFSHEGFNPMMMDGCGEHCMGGKCGMEMGRPQMEQGENR